MKRFLLLSVLALCLKTATAHTIPHREGIVRGADPYSDSTQDASLQKDLEDITQAIGLQNNFELRPADVLNIEASISHKKRVILYNPVFIDWINKCCGNKWASIALVAHELGHHLNGHTLRRSGSEPALELEADEFAGYVLQRMGATVKEAQEVMYFIAGNQASRTHPARQDRMLAIEKGWRRGAQLIPDELARKNIRPENPQSP